MGKRQNEMRVCAYALSNNQPTKKKKTDAVNTSLAFEAVDGLNYVWIGNEKRQKMVNK